MAKGGVRAASILFGPPDPTDAILLLAMGWIAAYGGAKETIESEAQQTGFAIGLAAGLLGMSPEWVMENLVYQGITPNHFLREQGIRERAYFGALAAGYQHVKNLSPEQRDYLLSRPLAQGYMRDENAKATEDDVRVLQKSVIPTVRQIFRQMEKQREEEASRQQQLQHQRSMELRGCIGFKC